MSYLQRYKTFVLILLDTLIFYGVLVGVILIRFHNNFAPNTWSSHLFNFTPIFIIWLIVFYISHLYETRFVFQPLKLISSIGRISIVNLFLSILYFYLLPITDFTPKTNLILIWGFSNLLILLSHIWLSLITQKQKPLNTILISNNQSSFELIETLKNNPQLGYAIIDVIEDIEDCWKLERLISSSKIQVIVVDKTFQTKEIKNILFNSLLNKIKIVDFVDFYESILNKTPLSLIDDPEFLSKLEDKSYQILEPIKRTFDIFFGILILLITLPLWLIIIPLILIDKIGPIFYIGKRIGIDHKPFFLIKFRSMIPNASLTGPGWTLPNDQRITKIGKLLRKTYLDELPEILNVLKGDISLVGPRPEEAKLVVDFEKEIPFYNIRHIVKPGITGWAQIHYPNSFSIEGTKEKLQYDLYYLRHYSIWLDFMIILKTLRIPIDIKTH